MLFIVSNHTFILAIITLVIANNNYIVLSSMALDLRRVALGYNRGATAMADRFLEEALKRKEEVDQSNMKPYLVKLLAKIDTLKTEPNDSDKAENALLYSILFQNAAVRI